MRKILAATAIALLMSTAWTSAAHAEPVTIALFGAAFASTLAGTAVTVALQIGASLALSGLAYILTGGGRRQTASQSSTVTPATVQLPERAGLLERRQVYGTFVTGGGVFFQGTVADSGSTGPDVYVLGFALGDGEMDGLEAVIINGVECEVDDLGNPQTAPWYDDAGNLFKVSFRSGLTTQAIDPIIAARFPAKSSEYRQRGVATAVVEMKFGADADQHTELWGAGGIPDIKFRVRGRKIYDPRDSNQSHADPSTWNWTDNATLIEADWLTHSMGFGIAADEVDWDSVIESANVDDDWVVTLAGQERRGRINGVVLASEANDDVLQTMALSNRAIIRKQFGQYTIRADRVAEPVTTIHQGLLVGDFSFSAEPDMRSALNRAKLQFSPAANDNQSGETIYEDATALAADGQEFEANIGLRFIDSAPAAQRLGFAMVQENRVGKTFSGMFDIGVLVAPGKTNKFLEAGDVVRMWFENDYDAINGLYTVQSIEISQDFTVGLSLAGWSADILNGWSVDLETAYETAA